MLQTQHHRQRHPGDRRRRRRAVRRGRCPAILNALETDRTTATAWCSKWRSIWANRRCARSRWTRPKASCAAGSERHRQPIAVPVGPGTLGRIMNVIGEPVDEAGPIKADETRPIHQPSAQVHRAIDRSADPRHRHQGRRPARALRQGRQDRPVRRRRRRQDGDHSGTDQQHRQEARRLFGVRRRRRAYARRQRPLSRDDRVGREQGSEERVDRGSKCALVSAR